MQPGKPQRNVNAPSMITKSGFLVKENFKSKESFAISNLRNSKMLLWVLKHYAIVLGFSVTGLLCHLRRLFMS